MTRCATHVKFKVHLNINSLASKFHHVNEILSHSNCGLLFLNETKLDDSMPSNLFNCNKYNLTRKERTGGKKGGGVAMYIKSCYTVAHIKTNHPFEIISFSLILHIKTRHFICAYKPPDTRAEEFIAYIEHLMLSLDQNNDIYIVGDLNMNWLVHKGKLLREFCENTELRNFFTILTRTVCTKTSTSSTLIDVLLHNKNSIIRTGVINFPFSDHCILIAEFTFDSVKDHHQISSFRMLDESALQAITNEIGDMDLSMLESIQDVSVRWLVFKSIFQNHRFHSTLKKVERKS